MRNRNIGRRSRNLSFTFREMLYEAVCRNCSFYICWYENAAVCVFFILGCWKVKAETLTWNNLSKYHFPFYVLCFETRALMCISLLLLFSLAFIVDTHCRSFFIVYVQFSLYLRTVEVELINKAAFSYQITGLWMRIGDMLICRR